MGLRALRKYWAPILALFLTLLFFILVTPISSFSVSPATGGDTGSHYYTFYTLLEYGFRVWSPGHLMGEPQLLHYFPGSFFIMAMLSLVLPMGLAFNVGTILPLALFPFSVWCGLRGLGYRRSTCFLGLSLSQILLYNEANSMWGGNAASLLAGQFAHLYALNFLMLGLGVLGWALRDRSKTFFSPLFLAALLFSAVAICHAYVFIFVPLVFLSFLMTATPGKRWDCFFRLVGVGFFSLLLSAWFLVPLIQNKEWTTAAPIKWVFANALAELMPFEIEIVFCAGLLLVVFIFSKSRIAPQNLIFLRREILFWLLPVVGSCGLFLLFPYLGLVDVRALPQAYLFVILFVGVLLGFCYQNWSHQDRWAMTGALMILASVLAERQIHAYPNWVRWNYSGWESKPSFKAAQEVLNFLKSDFSSPRVANEHNISLAQTGSPRIFELLPYFSHRAAMESLYVEATHTAYITTDIQARISQFPSCPVRTVPCPALVTQSLVEKMKLVGVRDLIIVTSQAAAKIEALNSFDNLFNNEMFVVFQLKDAVHYAEVLKSPPQMIDAKEWQKKFQEWYFDFDGHQNFLISKTSSEIGQLDFSMSTLDLAAECRPKVMTEYNWIELSTDCPGRWHLLKFTYHPAWQAQSGEPIYLISPGFMLIKPKKNFIRLEFSSLLLWKVSCLVSIGTFLVGILFLAAGFFDKLKTVFVKEAL